MANSQPSRRSYRLVAMGFTSTIAIVGSVAFGVTKTRSNTLQPQGYFATDGVANGGYDVVSYFTDGVPTIGSPLHTTMYQGVEWRFMSSESKTLFDANSTKYVPEYGGYRAWGLATKGRLFPTDPESWSIVNGRLFLNLNRDVQAKWNVDSHTFIDQADRLWSTQKTTVLPN